MSSFPQGYAFADLPAAIEAAGRSIEINTATKAQLDTLRGSLALEPADEALPVAAWRDILSRLAQITFAVVRCRPADDQQPTTPASRDAPLVLNVVRVSAADPACASLRHWEVLFEGWAYNYEKAREVRVRRAPTAGEPALPNAVRAHFEPWWAHRHGNLHNGMGGLPRASWRTWPHFAEQLYFTDQEGVLDWDTYPEMRSLEPPFDHDNAVLLELSCDYLVGWHWAGRLLTLIIPRADLAAGRFDRIAGMTGD